MEEKWLDVWYQRGFVEGVKSAFENLSDPESSNWLDRYVKEGRIIDFVNLMRVHQSRIPGDISYDVGKPGGPTVEQYALWEQGFLRGFVSVVEDALGHQLIER